mmetsp:Transcript_7201/g.9383  ORF Transcript_7201/g.9383 Transcript_7201/m.9383 type:complete len:532 (+) Transcript_7201:81-1676(+)
MASIFVPRFARIGAFTGLGMMGIYGYGKKDDEGLQRSAYFWSKTLPIYAHYRATQWWVETIKKVPDEEQDEYYEPLHDKYADKMLEIINYLKGFYIKIGQIGATRSDFLPKQFMDVVSSLQDEVPCEDFERVKKVLEKNFQRPLDEVFEWIEEKPVGSASIGQVHKAKLKSNGMIVAVKVMYPGVEQMFRGDISTMKNFCSLAQPEHLPALGEIEKQFLTEFDYRREAKNLEQIYQNMKVWSEKVVVPRPIWSSQDVLIMTFIDGIKLVDGLKKHFEVIAKSKGMTVDELKQETEEKEARGEKVEGLSREKMERYRKLMRTQFFLKASINFLYRWTIGPFVGSSKSLKELESPAESDLPLNTAAIIEDLLQVHGYQVLVNGYFNGDPHPGNILLTKDGKLGLIDYGQVKEISKEERITLARLILALSRDDKDEIVKTYTQMGFRTKKMNPDVIYKHCKTIFDNDHRDSLGMNIQLYLEQLQAEDPVVSMPDEYLMAGRVCVLLRGLAYALKYNPRVSKHWEALANEVLQEP